MLYQDNSTDNAAQKHDSVAEEPVLTAYQSDSNIQQELDILENFILEGVHVPLSSLIIVDGGVIIEHIKSIKQNLPQALAISIEILQQRQAIIEQASNQAQEVVKSAQAEADRLLQESTLLRQTELEANKIKFQTQQECEQLRQATYAEIEQWREMATIEYEAIQKDADRYADTVLNDLEVKLSQMLAIVHNGRHHLEPDEQNQPHSVTYD
ncbi:conserved hypothetical protein [Hyella patelloides LEGE 07179]|uniref:Uncharacterized protein n=1 Tax=Hyella patelloides LEGE 07179 TaxID=945734 RepID=A0A563W599_9CYAN|nr:ATP synthase F0 subunit B [Hyella patelloides]VEP18846.1 conserved hypothetical protein [Hyella patelloides LEGE 07179]